MIKRYLRAGGDHCKRFTKAWDYYCIGMGGFLAGYAYRKEHGESGEDTISEEFPKDGEHQLSVRTFTKWQQESASLPLKDLLNTYVPMIKFNNLNVTEDEHGNISFQGTGKRNEKT